MLDKISVRLPSLYRLVTQGLEMPDEKNAAASRLSGAGVSRISFPRDLLTGPPSQCHLQGRAGSKNPSPMQGKPTTGGDFYLKYKLRRTPEQYTVRKRDSVVGRSDLQVGRTRSGYVG